MQRANIQYELQYAQDPQPKNYSIYSIYIYMLFPVLLQNHGKVSKTVKMIWSLTARLFFNVLITVV